MVGMLLGVTSATPLQLRSARATGTTTAISRTRCGRAAVDVITERGLGSFSLREVARRAGVSAHGTGRTTSATCRAS